MGLDMYLYCNSKGVCQKVNDMDDEWEGGYQAPHGIAVYWCKANAVHNWFVTNVQGGVDDCREYEVTVTDLVKLHDACKAVLDSTKLVDSGTTDVFDFDTGKMTQKPLQVLEDDSVARELLPTRSGFFFGDTEYDMLYWWDVQFTERKLATLLDALEPKDDYHVTLKGEPDWLVTFRYKSSW